MSRVVDYSTRGPAWSIIEDDEGFRYYWTWDILIPLGRSEA